MLLNQSIAGARANGLGAGQCAHVTCQSACVSLGSAAAMEDVAPADEVRYADHTAPRQAAHVRSVVMHQMVCHLQERMRQRVAELLKDVEDEDSDGGPRPGSRCERHAKCVEAQRIRCQRGGDAARVVTLRMSHDAGPCTQ